MAVTHRLRARSVLRRLVIVRAMAIRGTPGLGRGGRAVPVLAFTIRARNVRYVVRRTLIDDAQYALADVALCRPGRLQLSVYRHSLIEHEALAVEVIAAHLFEITKDPAVQLIDFAKAALQQERCCFFTADPAGTKSDDGAVFG